MAHPRPLGTEHGRTAEVCGCTSRLGRDRGLTCALRSHGAILFTLAVITSPPVCIRYEAEAPACRFARSADSASSASANRPAEKC
ncbi:hypothetical protein [uncultured Duncaniella sp.]|uniref:hypothetical protein n=1 Tax=uncultured Duncaniella sp. TaxID=2768039 RepID=UPI0025B6B260|nr:hypothetical protein [uncultured Duncaniella sp.]